MAATSSLQEAESEWPLLANEKEDTHLGEIG